MGATLPGLYKQTPTSPWRHTSSTESKLGFQFFIKVERIPLVLLVLSLVHLDLVLVHRVLVLVPVLVSSSCNLENREREKRRAEEEEPDLSDLPQHCTFAATGSFFIVLQILQFIILSSLITFLFTFKLFIGFLLASSALVFITLE